MATHDELFARATPHLMATFGDPTQITVTPAGGSPVALTAILGQVVVQNLDPDVDGITQRRTQEVKLLRDPADVFGGVEELLSNAAFSIGGEAWTVDTEHPEAIASSPTWHTVQLISVGSVERTRPGYRR